MNTAEKLQRQKAADELAAKLKRDQEIESKKKSERDIKDKLEKERRKKGSKILAGPQIKPESQRQLEAINSIRSIASNKEPVKCWDSVMEKEKERTELLIQAE